MYYDELYENLCITMMRYANNKVAELKADLPTLGYFDWDTVSEAQELPDHDLFGPAGMGFTDEGKFYEVVLAFGASTKDDLNLFRLRKMMSKVVRDFRPEANFDIYRHETGQPVSWMVIKPPVTISPITRSATRPLQFIQLQAVVDPQASSRG